MPKISGPELIDPVLQTRPTVKVLYMSGYTGDDLSRRIDLEPTTPLLEKPFTASMLLQAVRDVLDQSSSASTQRERHLHAGATGSFSLPMQREFVRRNKKDRDAKIALPVPQR
jgi:FixJ family two-component response regulator